MATTRVRVFINKILLYTLSNKQHLKFILNEKKERIYKKKVHIIILKTFQEIFI